MNKDFLWWTGVVEDRDDPEMLGRCRVRILGYHSDSTTDIPTDELPWAYPAMPINTRPRSTPIGPVEGTWVMGFFKDGESAQQPVMTHVLDSGYMSDGNEGDGFNDPGNNYREQKGYPERPKRNYWPGLAGGFIPNDGTINEDWPEKDENKINRLAVGETKGTWVEWAGERRVTGISSAAPNHSWDEPESDYNAEYPFNKVEESESGHVFEVDDTPGHERISRRHKSGSYEELQNDGRVIKIHGDDYEIIVSNGRDPLSGSKHIYVDGNVNVTASGDINLKTTEGNVRIDSDKSIRMKADEFIIMEAGLGIMNDGMFFATSSGTPILHGGGSPMVVPVGMPTDLAPDLGLKYLSTGVDRFQDMLKKGLNVPPIIKDAIGDFESAVAEVESTVVQGSKAVEEAKVTASSLVQSFEQQKDAVEVIKRTSLDWREKVDEKIDEATFIYNKLQDPEFLTTELKDVAGMMSTHPTITSKWADLKEKTGVEFANKAVQLQQLSHTLNAANNAKDKVKETLQNTMRKAMQKIGTGLLTGTKIAFSLMELSNMISFGHAEGDPAAESSPLVVPLGVRHTIIFAGRYVIGKEYVINDLGKEDENWMDNWNKVTGGNVELKNGSKFIARAAGSGLGSAVLFYSVTDTSMFVRGGLGIIDVAKSKMEGGIPVLNYEDMKTIKDKNTLIALIELFKRPLGSSESEYFQTWLTDSEWGDVLERIQKGVEGYTSLEDVRFKLHEKSKESQEGSIPHVLDSLVESNRGLDLSQSGTEYGFSTLLDKDDVLQFSNRKRMSGELDRGDLDRLIELETSVGISQDEVLEVTRQELGNWVTGPRGARTYKLSGQVIYKAAGTNNSTVSGLSKAQVSDNRNRISAGVGNTAISRTPAQQLKDLQSKLRKGRWGHTNRAEKQRLESEIKKLEMSISNQRKLDGKPVTSEKKATSEVSTTKRQESNKPIGRNSRPASGNYSAPSRRRGRG